MHYYDKKYPYFKYSFCEADGSAWFMHSIPVKELINIYKSYYNTNPKSFFDCGAAIGELVHQADTLGLDAHGIDIKKYPLEKPRFKKYEKYFTSQQIQIKNILDCEPIKSDIAYCNGTLTYMNEQNLPLVLNKFKNVGILIAIHNTTEDIIAARQMGYELLHGEPRLIKPKQWWLNTFEKNDFKVDFNTQYGTFCALPKTSKPR